MCCASSSKTIERCAGCRIAGAESELRRLLAEHKQMYAAQDQQQEVDRHQEQAAVQRVEEARQQHKRYTCL